MFKKNGFVKLTSGMVLSASVPTLVSFAGSEDKDNDKVDWLMVLKIAGLCLTAVGFLAYIAALMSRKIELEKLNKQTSNIEVKKQKDMDKKLLELQKIAFQYVQVWCNKKKTDLNSKIEELEDINEVGVGKYAEKEFAKSRKKVSDIKNEIATEEKSSGAFLELQAFFNDGSISKKSECISHFFGFRMYKKLSEDSGNSEEQNGRYKKEMEREEKEYKERYKKITGKDCENEKEMDSFVSSFCETVKNKKIEDHLSDFMKSKCESVRFLTEDSVSVVKIICSLGKDFVFLSSGFSVFSSLCKSFTEQTGKFPEEIKGRLNNLNSELVECNEKTIEEQERKFIEETNKDLEQLGSLKERYGTLSSTSGTALNLLSNLPKAMEREEFVFKWKNLTKGLEGLDLDKESKQNLDKKYQDVMNFYNEEKNERKDIVNLEKAHNNLSKNRNFYRPWFLSENYD